MSRRRGLFSFLILAGLTFASASRGEDQPAFVLEPGGHTSFINGLKFSPDGKRLASLSDDGTVRLWDVDGGHCVRVFFSQGMISKTARLFGMSMSADGKTLATMAIAQDPKENTVLLLSLERGELLRVVTAPGAIAVALSPDGNKIYTASVEAKAGSLLREWRADTGKPGYDVDLRENEAGVAVSPDGRRLATWAADSEKKRTAVRVRAADTGKPARTFEIDDIVNRCEWTPDGKALVAVGDRVSVWSADGKLVKKIDSGSHTGFAISPDSRRIVLQESENLSNVNKTTVYDTATGAATWEVPSENLNPFAFSAALVAGAAPDGVIQLLRSTDGKLIRKLGAAGKKTDGAAWAKDGSAFFWGTTDPVINREKATCPLERGFRWSELQPLPKEDKARPADPDRPVTPDGRAIVTSFPLLDGASAAPNGPSITVSQGEKALGELTGHLHNINGLALSPNGRVLLSSSDDRTLRLWNWKDRTLLLSVFPVGSEWIAWTPDGYYAASPGGEQLMGWAVSNGKDKLPSFYAAAQFRKTFYRPDVVQRVLETGSVAKALALADAAAHTRTPTTEVAKILPPKVRILSPERGGQKLTSADLTVKAEAVDDVHPIASLQLLLDGRPMQMRNLSSPQTGKVGKSFEIDVPPGTHRLSVKAVSDVSTGVSEEVEVTFGAAASPTKVKAGDLHVVAIGVNQYPASIGKLNAAVPDAQAIVRAFQDNGKKLFRNIDVRLLADQEATRANILKAMDALATKAKPGDLAVVFYAGHGDSEKTGQLQLLPIDADIKKLKETGVSAEDLKTKLGGLPCTTLVILDACFSGSFSGLKKKGALHAGTDKLVRELIYEEGLVVMCGAAKDEEAAEEKGHGYFTTAICDGLSGKAQPDEDGLIDISAMQVYVERAVKKLSDGEQMPTIHRPSTVRVFPVSRP